MSSSILKAISYAGVYVGAVIGAGYASGQEVLQFFAGYGLVGIIGAILTTTVGTTGQCLLGNTSAAPTWGACPGDGVGISSLNGQTGATQTFANDTNITISSSANTHTLTWAGNLATGRGGTGLTTYAAGDLLYASASNTLASLAIGSNNQCLIITAGVPTWGSCTAGGGGFTNLSLDGDSGTPETIGDTDTITIAGGTNITTSVGATDTVTVNLDNAPTISGLLTLSSAGTALSVTNNATISGAS